MRTTFLALALLGGVATTPALAQQGATLPGAQFQRRLGGAAGPSCTATNALHTRQCSTSCQTGELADCEDEEGDGTPTCQCTKE